MAAAGNDRSFHVCSPYAQQKYSNISCFWEKQPSGCLRISCAFHHSKPRSINGLFLPPSNNAPLQQGVQEGIPHPAHGQESLRNQKNILRPIHPPLTIHLNDEDDDEDDDEEEENGAPDWVPQTAADLEEERAIKEICYQSGEYYGIQYPQEHQSTKTVSSPRENELLPWEATERDLQAGDGDTIPTTFKNAKGEGESSGTTVPAETIPRTDRGSFENGGTNRMERVKNYPGKEAKEKQWVSEEERIHTPDPKAKPRRQQRGQTVPQPYAGKRSKPKNQLDANRRFWTQTESYEPRRHGSEQERRAIHRQEKEMKPVLRLTRAIEIEMWKLSAGKSKEDTIANSKNKMQEVHDNVSKLIENTKYTFCVITDPLSSSIQNPNTQGRKSPSRHTAVAAAPAPAAAAATKTGKHDPQAHSQTAVALDIMEARKSNEPQQRQPLTASSVLTRSSKFLHPKKEVLQEKHGPTGFWLKT
ncbi:uncharacterized protein C12orf50 homolog [Grus americana]|uniref:uncharacterized protein C12orf50 homolog n=1 Tax=Grus americana TaxID=9117 RepID=UPI002407AB40|nr:uncharacterized protein C12orf50 homolog [Grus americana]